MSSGITCRGLRRIASMRLSRFVTRARRPANDELFPTPVMAEGLLDRLLNSAYMITMLGKTYRQQQRPGSSPNATSTSRGDLEVANYREQTTGDKQTVNIDTPTHPLRRQPMIRLAQAQPPRQVPMIRFASINPLVRGR
jgi:hypothetical protein